MLKLTEFKPSECCENRKECPKASENGESNNLVSKIKQESKKLHILYENRKGKCYAFSTHAK